MVAEATPLRSRRKKARYADLMVVGETPVAIVKSGRVHDFVTAEEFAEDLYGKPVDHIVFCEDLKFQEKNTAASNTRLAQ